MNYKSTVSVCMLILMTAGAAVSTSCTPGSGVDGGLPALEEELSGKLDGLETDAAFTLLLESGNGRTFSRSIGDSSDETLYRSASTSKLVTAVIILKLVQDGVLSLSDHPQDYIDFWPADGAQSQITLHHLLSFTSGLANEGTGINSPLADFRTVVSTIPGNNASSAVPGTEFYYSSSHLQVAGLMAVEAAGAGTWQDVFDSFKGTELFQSSSYSLPSEANPRLAGGMWWTGRDYLKFLEDLYHGRILDAGYLALLTQDQTAGAAFVYSPAMEGLGEDWHYGYGNWIECHEAVFNAGSTSRNSSPGAYGAYVFLDFDNRYFGVLAREGELGTFTEGYALFDQISADAEQWAALAGQ